LLLGGVYVAFYPKDLILTVSGRDGNGGAIVEEIVGLVRGRSGKEPREVTSFDSIVERPELREGEIYRDEIAEGREN
jgi:hypothetical protein